MEKIPLTRAGYDALNEELKALKSVERPAVIRAIAEAREHGDLSENAEYHAARERQSFIEGRVKELEGILALAEVIDTSKLSGAVKFGARVTLIDEDTEEEKTFQLVGEPEADLERGLSTSVAARPRAHRQGRGRHGRGAHARRREELRNPPHRIQLTGTASP
jgi:transcription elongation factor GreA